MRSFLNFAGTIVLVVVVFWIIGVLTTPGVTGAAAVGNGIKETINFFVSVVNHI